MRTLEGQAMGSAGDPEGNAELLKGFEQKNDMITFGDHIRMIHQTGV